MMHISVVRKMLRDKVSFSCRVWKKDGEILVYKDVVCSSSSFERNTANLIFVESREMRTVRIISIFEVNDEEIYI